MCVIPELKEMYMELCKELSQLIYLVVIIYTNVPNSFQEMCMNYGNKRIYFLKVSFKFHYRNIMKTYVTQSDKTGLIAY